MKSSSLLELGRQNYGKVVSDKKINLTFRMTEERQEELKIFAAKRRMSLQRMIERGLELLLAEPGTTPLKVMPGAQKSVKSSAGSETPEEWLRLMDNIAEGDDPAWRHVVLDTLVHLAELSKSVSRRSGDSRKVKPHGSGRAGNEAS